MTDLTLSRAEAPPRPAPAPRHADSARLARRYARDRRFRFYGLGALAITAAFLAMLLFNIVATGWPALWQHSLRLAVDAKPDALGLTPASDPRAIRTADYFPVVRDALKTAVPGIETRAAEKALMRLVSTSASDGIRDRLLADPKLIGQSFTAPLRLSANADLYFKAPPTAITSAPGRGVLGIAEIGGGLTLRTTGDDFRSDLARIKAMLAGRAATVAAEADRLARLNSEQVAAKIAELRDEAGKLRQRASDATAPEELDGSMPSLLLALNGGLVKITKLGAQEATGDVLLPLKATGEAKPGDWQLVTYATPERNRKATDQEIAFLEALRASGAVEKSFNWSFFTTGDSREPETAGILGALTGTALTLLITLVLCLPIGVLSAVYLEEFAPKNTLTDLIEVSINNLAAVPSIVFGLLGLAVFINFFDLPRSAPLVGGLVLALLVLPTIIIASRAAIKAVPPSIKEAALGVGASHQQAVFHHVLPLAMPGIMTGTIIGMAHALGETAPLLMIGMVAFIVDIPQGIVDAATVLPVQIYLWSDLPEAGFKAKTAAAIMVLLAFLFVMNGAAIWLRKRFERRW